MNPNWIARMMGWAMRLTAVGDDPANPPADPPKDPPADPPKDPPADPPKDPPKDPPGDPWLGIRETYAGGDEKKLAKLGRYATPTAALDAFISLQDRLRSGELKAQLPKNATEAQVKSWREENGIPESPDKYELKLTGDTKIADEDRPYVDSMLKAIHSHGANSQIASTVVDLYYDVQRQMTEARVAKDAEFNKQAEDALRVEWGNEYRLNMNQNQALLAMMPADVAPLFTHGRLSNGDPMMSHPGVLKWLNGLAREINPVATLVPDSGGDIAGSIESEIKKIETLMKSPKGSPEYKQYWEGADGEATQKRYRELLDGKERAAGKK